MKTISSIHEMRQVIMDLKHKGKAVSLVPTMGNLHEGHVSLVKKAKSESDVVAVSIFVNPTQFGPSEDFNKYPRTLDADMQKIQSAGCDIVFTPSVEEMYENNSSPRAFISDGIFVSVSQKSNVLCGQFRPGHFDGVLTVVLKLFNICVPNKAYFGLKDYQQYLLIKDMTESLNLDVEVIPCPLVRDKDGLALSSRNSYLTAEQRTSALSLNRALGSIKNAFNEGEKQTSTLKGLGLSIMLSGGMEVQYLEIMNAQTLKPVNNAGKGDLVAVAGFCGNTRLIDNIIL
jgi:pantoate--beta-alanine ligase